MYMSRAGSVMRLEEVEAVAVAVAGNKLGLVKDLPWRSHPRTGGCYEKELREVT